MLEFGVTTMDTRLQLLLYVHLTSAVLFKY